MRVWRAGLGLYYVPDAVIWHHVAATEKLDSPARCYHRSRSSAAFFAKHTKGLLWLVVIPYRIGSAVRKLTQFIRRGQADCARAYLRGLWDGVRGRRKGLFQASH
jgi:GT2 family glycosyltransferase